MKKVFKINNATYYLPTCWDEVTYNQYAEIAALDAELSGTDKAAKIVSIVAGVPLETLEAAGIGLVVPLFDELAFLQTPPVAVAIEHVTVLGTSYYAQPIATVGELAAFDRVNSAVGISDEAKLPYILAILLRQMQTVTPVKPTLLQKLLGRKTGTDAARVEYEAFQNDEVWVTKRAKLFGSQLSPAQVMGLASFFLLSAKRSQMTTPHFLHLVNTLARTKELLVSTSAASMGGKPTSTIWSRICSTILRYYVRTLERSLTGSSTSGK